MPNRVEVQKRRRVLERAMWGLVVLLGAAFTSYGREVKDQTGRVVIVPEHPTRLVSLAPAVTETIFLLGLGDHVVGDTDYCEYPPEAKLKPHVGSILNPSLEKIVALKPDLVVGSPEANRRETAEQLGKFGIPLYGVTARTVDETLASISGLGGILGRGPEAEQLVAGLQRRIDAVTERVAHEKRPKVLFVVWYRPLQTAGSKTFISDVIGRAGGDPVNHGLEGEWPKLSLEEALRLDPDVILFPSAASFSPSLEEFHTLPGWRDFRAVTTGRMYVISDSIIRSSPRLVDALEEVAHLLHPVSPKAGGAGR